QPGVRCQVNRAVSTCFRARATTFWSRCVATAHDMVDSRLGWCIMRANHRANWPQVTLGGAVLLLIANSFQACGVDTTGSSGGDGAGGRILGGGPRPDRDAGEPRTEADASPPEPELDASVGAPDADNVGTPTLVTRQLCIFDGEVLRRVSFPSYEVV